ncbi:MAG: hypothetical protein ACR2RF_29625 [Geminicoccaceae bacterium]
MSWIVHCKDRTAPVIPADGAFAAVAINHPLVIVSTFMEVAAPGTIGSLADFCTPQL